MSRDAVSDGTTKTLVLNIERLTVPRNLSSIYCTVYILSVACQKLKIVQKCWSLLALLSLRRFAILLHPKSQTFHQLLIFTAL